MRTSAPIRRQICRKGASDTPAIGARINGVSIPSAYGNLMIERYLTRGDPATRAGSQGRLAALPAGPNHSHSIVAGGFELMSYTTRFTPLTSLAIRLEMWARTSGGNGNQSAVIPSRLVTARKAIT
jgi:hypothetical protein